MQKNNKKITIAGTAGSGKGTIVKRLADKYDLRYMSIGDLRRSMATDMGITLEQLNELGKTDPTTDTKADDYTKQFGQENDAFVIDARLAHHFVDDAYKIYLACDTAEAARRVWADPRDTENKYNSVQELAEAIDERTKVDQERYSQIYDLDPYSDLDTQYDLVVDTTDLDKDQVWAVVDQAVAKHFGDLV